MDLLPDGTYDVIVVDVEEIDENSARVELAITSGAHKGELIALRASHANANATDMLGLPGTLRVDDGVPRVELDH